MTSSGRDSDTGRGRAEQAGRGQYARDDRPQARARHSCDVHCGQRFALIEIVEAQNGILRRTATLRPWADLPSLDEVHLLYEDEDGERHDDEADDLVEQLPVGEDRNALGFRLGQRRGHASDESSTKNRLEKSTRPSTRPSGGISTPSTSVVTILPNAAPMITPTARSMTLPRAMKSRNSLWVRSLPRARSCAPAEC